MCGPLVSIQPDLIHILHGGASFAVSEPARSLSQFLCSKRSSIDLCIQTDHPLVYGQTDCLASSL